MDENEFWDLVAIGDGCWEWRGSKMSRGYGRRHGKLAHRLAFEFAVGPIDDGLHVHHDCQNPGCVRPDHLRALTPFRHSRAHMAMRKKEATAWESRSHLAISHSG